MSLLNDRKQRLVVSSAAGDGLGFLGWEVADAAALDGVAARLEARGVAVSHEAHTLVSQALGESTTGGTPLY